MCRLERLSISSGLSSLYFSDGCIYSTGPNFSINSFTSASFKPDGSDGVGVGLIEQLKQINDERHNNDTNRYGDFFKITSLQAFSELL
jgi:hypothetical protein